MSAKKLERESAVPTETLELAELSLACPRCDEAAVTVDGCCLHCGEPREPLKPPATVELHSGLELAALRYVAARAALEGASSAALLEAAVDVDAAWHALHLAAGASCAEMGEDQ